MELKKYKSNVKKIFIIVFLKSLVFAYVIERIFESERGLSVLQMQYLFITYSLILLILEIPFGVLADKWKRKYVWALGAGISSLWGIICIFAYNFETFLVAYIATAIGNALVSGTWDSILYESLYKINKHNEYEKMRGYLKLLKYAGNGMIGMLGGYIAYRFGLVTNYWLSLVSVPAAIVLTLTLYEPAKENSQKSINKPKVSDILLKVNEHITESIKAVRQNNNLLHIIFYGGVIGAVLYGQLHEVTSLTYPKIGIPIYLFGVVGFASTLLGGLSGIIGAKLKERFSYNAIFRTVLILSTVAIFMYSNASHGWEVIYVIIAIFLMEMVHPLTSGYVHNNITDKYRATISSIQGFVLNGLTIIVGLIFGYFADKYSIFIGFKSLCVILAIYGGIFFVYPMVRKKLVAFRVSSVTKHTGGSL